MIEYLVVAIIVLAATLFSAWRLMPDRHRLRLLQYLARRTHANGNGWLARVERAARADLAKGCAGCAANADAAAPGTRRSDALRR